MVINDDRCSHWNRSNYGIRDVEQLIHGRCTPVKSQECTTTDVQACTTIKTTVRDHLIFVVVAVVHVVLVVVDVQACVIIFSRMI